MIQGEEVEKRIIAVLRKRKNFFKYYSILDEDYFQLESTRQVFSLIKEFFDNRKNQETRLTRANLKLLVYKNIRNEDLRKDCIKVLKDLRNFSVDDSDVVEEVIRDFSARQLLKGGLLAGIEEANLSSPNYQKIREMLDKAILVSTTHGKETYQYFSDPEGRMDAGSDNHGRIMTFIPTLNEALDGGYGPGELIVYLAPPERGKTLALVNDATSAMFQGKKICYLSLELSERKIARRFDLRISGRPIELLRKDPSRIKNPLASLRKNGCDLIIKDYSFEAPRVSDIRSFIINYENRMRKKIDMLVIDYADLITPEKMHKQERFGIKEVYTNLRRLANELKIPIVTASQANRKALNKMVITIEDFAECFEKAAIADVILGICQTEEEMEDELCRFYIAKNRTTGRHISIRLTMKPKTMFLGEYRREEEGGAAKDKTKSAADRI